MKQSTFSAVMANSIKNLLQGYTKGIRFVAVLMVLLTVGIGQAWGETWEKVTSAPTDWSGDYLIVYEDGKVAFDGSRTTLDAASNTFSVAISNGKITTESTTGDTKYFTIAKSGTSYTIKSKSGYYIGQTSNDNGLKSSTSTTYSHTISLNNDKTVNLVSGSAYLRYNSASDQKRFRYYKSSSYTNQKAIQLYKKVASCTAPTSVSISGEWGYFAGETISLKANPTGGGTPTGYQWYKNGTAISGATSSTYSKSNCTDSDAGNYTCKVSTGATCSTTSSAFVLRVYSLQNYTGGTTTHNFTRVGTTKTGTVEVVLTNNKQYEFKIFAGNSLYLGNNGTINADISNWVFETNTDNVKLNSGLGGTFIFTIDYSSDSSKPKISVSYPRKTIYMNCGNTSWCDSDPAFFAHTWGNGDYDVKLTQHPCDETVYLAEDIPAYNSYIIFTRQKPGSAQLEWSGDNFWNQSEDITIGTNDLFTCTGWNNNKGTFSGGTYTPPTYTITFKGNGNTGGSMTNVTGIPCEGSTTLVGNGYTRTGYTFNGWKDAGGKTYTDKATISNVKSNITLTAQWKANTYTITLNGNNGSGHTASVTATYNSATLSPSTITNPTRIGYTFKGWYSSASGGSMVIGIDGKLQANVSGYTGANGVWTATSVKTLYAQWTPITYQVKFNGNGSTSGSMSNQTFTYGTAQNLTANAFEKTGYNFAGWATTANGNVVYLDKQSVSNLTATNGETINLYAKWEAKQITITWDPNGGSVTPTSSSYTYDGAAVNLPTPTRTGYTFNGWFTAASGGTKITEVGTTNKPTANVTYYAQWTHITYTVKWSVDGSITTETVNHGSKPTQIPVTSTPSCGDKFVGWTTEEYKGDTQPDPLYTNEEIPTITEPTTFYAVFADYAD